MFQPHVFLAKYLLRYIHKIKILGDICKCKQHFWTPYNSFFHKLYQKRQKRGHYFLPPDQNRRLSIELNRLNGSGVDWCLFILKLRRGYQWCFVCHCFCLLICVDSFLNVRCALNLTFWMLVSLLWFFWNIWLVCLVGGVL